MEQVRNADRQVGRVLDSATQRGVIATYVAFGALGVLFATWVARIPSVSDRLQLSPEALGLVLLALAVGAIIALPAAGPIVHRIGSRRTYQVMAIINASGLLVIGIGHQFSILWLVCGLALFGLGQGGMDVAMNVQGALVERRLGRSIMARFHAGFSVGAVIGALLAVVVVGLGVPAWLHLSVVAGLGMTALPPAVRGFIDDRALASEAEAQTGPRRSPMAAWLEPRTLLLGVFVMAFAFAEGSGNDWIAKGLISAYAIPEWAATLGLTLFLAAMTLGRWFGPGWLDRYGRLPVIRWLSALSIVGVLIFAWGGSIWVSSIGAVLWGVGVSLGFPLGMSAGADEGRYAAARVSVIASIGYTAFLAGPPLIGFLAAAIGGGDGIIKAMTSVAVLVAIAVMISGAVRPPNDSPPA